MVNGVKKLAILGSTGSIGSQTLNIVGSLREQFEVVGLAGGANVSLLAAQAAEFRPEMVYFLNGTGREDFPSSCRQASMEEMATHPDVDLVVVATAGKAGLIPTLAALAAGKSVALANKEALVMAGHLVVAAAAKSGGRIFPIDSEHSAVWQCLRGETPNFQCCAAAPAEGAVLPQVDRLILTASGGAFRQLSEAELVAVTPKQALSHPVWTMGKKITVDSATLMNKGLEVIEAHWLFGIPYSRIDVLVHFEGIIHSLVEFVDGSVKAQLGVPDMRLPIQYALTYPHRIGNPDLPRLDLAALRHFSFSSPDYGRFPSLGLAIEAGAKGGTFPAVLCATDEIAVSRFLNGEIGFMEIPKLVADVLSRHTSVAEPSLEEILGADQWAREQATYWLTR